MNRNAKSDWYDLLHPSVQVFSRDPAVQLSRRKVWDKAMSLSGWCFLPFSLIFSTVS
jgi:hypothetical protein